MKGNTLAEFMDDLFACGGPEKEFTFCQKRYFLETALHEDTNLIELHVFEIGDLNDIVFSCACKTLRECVEQFESAKIFDGKTIYEAEGEIEVLYG